MYTTPIPPKDEDMNGIPPNFFDGNRSKADHFIVQFNLYRHLNQRDPVITNPKQRIALALSYMRGPKVYHWVSQQIDAYFTGDADHAPMHANTDETLWEDFITEFKREFYETEEEVRTRLMTLRMTGDNVELYIASFNSLVRKAQIEREDSSMVYLFRQGLPANLEQSIMDIKKRETIPVTLEEWQSAAREEVNRRRLERERLMGEGRCFKCRRKGHRARNCPDKLNEGNVRNLIFEGVSSKPQSRTSGLART